MCGHAAGHRVDGKLHHHSRGARAWSAILTYLSLRPRHGQSVPRHHGHQMTVGKRRRQSSGVVALTIWPAATAGPAAGTAAIAPKAPNTTFTSDRFMDRAHQDSQDRA